MTERTAIAQATPVQPLRRPELDWLRVGAVVLVFLAHVAQIFSPFESWLIESPDRSRVVGQLTVLVGPWLMPLFMLVAGGSAWFALRRYPVRRFFQKRVLRLLVPLVAGTFLVIPPQMYYRSLARGTFEGSFLQFYPRFFDGVFPQGNFSYGHLWFLVYLFLIMTACLPVMGFLRGRSGRRFLRKVADACQGRVGLLWLLVPMAASQIVLRVPFTMTTGAVVNDWATLVWFALAFLYGFAIMGETRLLTAVDQQWRRLLWPALLSIAVLLVWAWPGDVYARIPGTLSVAYVLWWTTFCLACWTWMVVILGATRRHMGAPAPWLPQATTAAYPFYILHQPVIVMVAYYVVGWPLSIAGRFAVIALTAFVLTTLIIEVLRRVPGLRVLLGLPDRPAVTVADPGRVAAGPG